ncbi:DUF676-domain-containing protein [Meredithblackwellia eburnea MCA 4105]
MTENVHLLVVCHGLWGTRAHVQYVCKSAQQHVSKSASTASRPRASSLSSPSSTHPQSQTEEEEDIKLVVLAASQNEDTRTYDGIDVCAERVVVEIDEEIQRIEAEGGKVTRFSIFGYSLGGLVARYAIGLLDSRSPSFFKDVRPVNFTTFASPAIGIPRYDSFWSGVLRFLGARLLSRSGAQLYGNDRFLPSSLIDDAVALDPSTSETCSSKKKKMFSSWQKEKAEPLLAVMADPRFNFYKALAAFERVEVYANSVKDRTVPYPTGAIEAHDPFALARAKAQKIANERGDDPEAEPDIKEGGLEVKLLEGSALLVASWSAITDQATAPTSNDDSKTSGPSKTRKRSFLRLPLLLRPTTYPFSRPVSLLIIFTLPLALPLSLIFLVGRFLLAGRSSKRRIRAFRTRVEGGREGWLKRVGVEARVRQAVGDVVENAQSDNPEDSVAEGSSMAKDIDTETEENPVLVRHPSLAPFTNYGGTDTPPLARPVSPSHINLPSSLSTALPVPIPTSSPSRYPTDPILTPAQLTMIKNLNSIPQLRKHLVFAPHARNSHGMIVCRDLKFPQHREAREIVDSWAKDFRL